MPKKIFNSDLETSGAVKATSITDGTATLSGGVLTASTLTDGTATLSGGILTASTLTDGTATISGGILTASTLTDGTATISGGILTASTLTDGTASLSGGILTASQVISPVITAVADSDLNIRADDSVVVTIDYDEDANEAEDYPAFQTILKTGSAENATNTLVDVNQYYTHIKGHISGEMLLGNGYSTLRSSGNIELGIDTGNASGSEEFVVYRGAAASFDAGAVELFKVDSTGKATADSIECDTFKTNNVTMQFTVDADNDSDIDYFRFQGTDTSFLTLRETSSLGHSIFLNNPDPSNYKSPVLETNTGLGGTAANNFLNAKTALRSYRDINLTVGTGFTANDSLGATGSSVNICKPTWSGGDITGETVVARIDSSGNAYVEQLNIEQIAQEDPSPNTDTHDLTIDPDDGRVRYASSTQFTGTHTYRVADSLEAGMAVTLTANNELALCSSSNSPTCVGLVVKELVNPPNDGVIVDSFGNIHTSARDYKLVSVASVGDSRHKLCLGFNVCNENGDVQPGDLLVTSSTPGYLMKQDDDIMRSKTVGKAMEAVTFDDNGQATGVYGFIYCG